MAPSDSKMEAEISGLPEICVGIQGLRKRVLQKGNSWQTPFPGDEVEGKCLSYTSFFLPS